VPSYFGLFLVLFLIGFYGELISWVSMCFALIISFLFFGSISFLIFGFEGERGTGNSKQARFVLSGLNNTLQDSFRLIQSEFILSSSLILI